MIPRLATLVLPGLLVVATPIAGLTQWTNRYPKVDGYRHHVYLEGYELPTLTTGPFDPAPSPDGEAMAFASRGWIWVMDLTSGVARRLTRGGDLDFRPAWSPDGSHIAFVRDNRRETSVVVVELSTGNEKLVINTPKLDLDPTYSVDGRLLYYSSADSGSIDLWKVDLGTQQRTRLTRHRGLELKSQPHPDGQSLLYLSKRPDEIRLLSIADGAERTLASGSILSMTRPALDPDGQTVAVNWPTQHGWQLRVIDVDNPATHILLTESQGPPLTPAWSSNGQWIYFSEADSRQRMVLKRIPAVGGSATEVPVRVWNWGVGTATLVVTTRVTGQDGPAPARLNVLDEAGHPAIPNETPAHFDGQNGRVFAYSAGVVEITVPAGEFTVSAVRGLTTPEVTVTGRVAPGETRDVLLELTPVWNARENGWTSGDHHFHLNYGGQYKLFPEHLVLHMEAENLDVATPLLANLHNRFENQDLWGWQKSGDTPLIWFGQEIRSHFLGHVGLIGIQDLFWPWVWGPGYQVYGRDDRTNVEALRRARAQGGLGMYVHPIVGQDPFAPDAMGSVPIELVADGVLGDLDALEVVCLWSDELGTSAMWHRLLNLGIPVAPSAGTDVMNNLYRTMAVGTTRVYAQTGEVVNWPTYLAALRAGKSFVTNGPLLEFIVEGVAPGEVVPAATTAWWTLSLHSAVPVDRVEILVNGEVAWSDEGLTRAGSKQFSGSLTIPTGGWIAARAHGGDTQWPAMDSYPFAHTAPLWIRAVGSTDPDAAQEAAQELLQVLETAEARLLAGYEGVEIPKLRERFQQAREKLERLAER